MKRNAAAVAQNPVNNKKIVRAAIVKTTYITKESTVDTNKLSADEASMIKNIDAHLQDLYYLTDEEDIIGFC